MNARRVKAGITGLLLVGALVGARAQDRIAHLCVSTVYTNLELGYAVDLNGDYAILGGPGEGGEQWQTGGEAYIFHRDGTNWVQQARLVPSDSGIRDRFGMRVAIQDPYAAVVASATGHVYLFQRDGTNWTEHQRITPTGGCASVALYGNYMAIGAPDESSIENQSGAVYIYGLNGSYWEQRARLKASDPHVVANFGETLALESGRLLVGDWTTPCTNGTTGKAYYFEEVTSGVWTQRYTFMCTNALFFGEFGYDVALLGNQALVAAYDSAGDAWINVYEQSGQDWIKVGEMNDPLTTAFGRGVALSEDWMAGGAIGPPAPAAMVYQNGDEGPVRQLRYTALRTASSYYTYYSAFHFPIAISGNEIIIGYQNDATATSFTNNGALIYTVNPFNRQYRVDGTNDFIYSGIDDGAMGAIAIGEGVAAVSFMPSWYTSAVVQVFVETAQVWEARDTLRRQAVGDPKAWMGFGSALDMDVDTLAIGSPNVSSGALDYVFVYAHESGNWVEQHVTTLATNQGFGTAVAVAGNLLAMGAPERNNPTFQEGGVLIHQRTGTNWAYQTELTGSAFGDQFGKSVDLTTNRLITGSFGADALNGKAWIYRHDGGGSWASEAELQPPVLTWEDYYGYDVAISEDYAAVGAPQGTNGGFVMVYQREDTTWNPIATLFAPIPYEGDQFGCSVALNNTYLLVGADDTGVFPGRGPGRSYLYRLNGTNVILAVNTWPGNPDEEYQFGKQVALSDGYGAVGVGTTAEGYVLTLPDQPKPMMDSVTLDGLTLRMRVDNTLPGTTYDLMRSSSMFPPEWNLVDTLTPTSTTPYVEWDTLVSLTDGFYRVEYRVVE